MRRRKMILLARIENLIYPEVFACSAEFGLLGKAEFESNIRKEGWNQA